MNCPLKAPESEDIIYPTTTQFMTLLYWKSSASKKQIYMEYCFVMNGRKPKLKNYPNPCSVNVFLAFVRFQ